MCLLLLLVDMLTDVVILMGYPHIAEIRPWIVFLEISLQILRQYVKLILIEVP